MAKVFQLTVASTGLPAKRLKQEGMAYLSSTTQSNSHASYYPGATPIVIKLTFSPTTGQIYGAQAVGSEGVDKRIDQVAQIIKHKGTIANLLTLLPTLRPKTRLRLRAMLRATYSTGKCRWSTGAK